MSVIVFHGDSWTWGSGLQYYYLIEKHDYSIEELEKFSTKKVRLEKFPKKVDDYRKKYHFPNLVAEHFNVPYVLSKEGNGSDNEEIQRNIRNSSNYWKSDVQLHVVQLSSPLRTNNECDIIKEASTAEEIVRIQVDKIIKSSQVMIHSVNDIPLFFLCWFKEHADYIKERYPEKLIPIHYNNEVFSSYDRLNTPKFKEDKLSISYDIGFDDFHFSKKGHKVIANSIINKISKESIEFDIHNIY